MELLLLPIATKIEPHPPFVVHVKYQPRDFSKYWPPTTSIDKELELNCWYLQFHLGPVVCADGGIGRPTVSCHFLKFFSSLFGIPTNS